MGQKIYFVQFYIVNISPTYNSRRFPSAVKYVISTTFEYHGILFSTCRQRLKTRYSEFVFYGAEKNIIIESKKLLSLPTMFLFFALNTCTIYIRIGFPSQTNSCLLRTESINKKFRVFLTNAAGFQKKDSFSAPKRSRNLIEIFRGS